MLIANIMHPALFVVLVIVVALVLFVTELIPVPATAMLVSLSLYLGGVITSKQAVAGFASDNAMIIAGLGIIGETLYRTGAAAKIGTLIERVAKTERIFVFCLVLVTGLLATCMSVGGSAALMISVALGISQSTNYRRSKLMYPIAVGVALGGGVTTVGSSSTLFLHELLADMGMEMKFFELAPICIILLVVSALFLSTIGFNLLPDVPNNEDRFTFSGSKNDFSNVPKWKPTMAMAVLAATFLAMYFSSQLGLNVGMIAVLAAFVVIASKLISVKEAFGAIPMGVIVMYTFLTPLSNAMENSGASEILADFLSRNAGSITSPLLVILVIYLIGVPLTNVMSNAATIIMLAPITVAVSKSLGLNPMSTLMTVRMAGTLAYITPIGSPPMTMALEPGGYSFMDYVKTGIPLTVITVTICIIYFYIAYPIFL